MNALNTAIYSKLSGGTALTALVSLRLYHMQAPLDAAYPYVVWNTQGGGDENVSPHRTKNLVLNVRAYSDVTAAAAGSVDAQIDALLHNQSLSVTGWSSIWLAREQDIETVENPPDNVAVYMQGGLYRVVIEHN